MASSINASTTAGVVTTADTSGVLNIQTAGTTAISIDASQAVSFTNAPTVTGGTANGVAYLNGSKVLTTGSALVFDGTNLGIKFTPSAWQANNRAIQVADGYASLSGNSSQGTCDVAYNCYNTTSQAVLGWKYTNSSAAATLYQQLNGIHAWHIAPSGTANAAVTFTQAMTLNASGNLLLGTTAVLVNSDERFTLDAGANYGLVIRTTAGTTAYPQVIWNAATTGDNLFVSFATETSYTIKGSISFNRAGGLTVYGTTSDYRAKTVNGSIQNALTKVALLKPSTGRMNGAEQDIDFFVAHELQEVVPSAVTGQKDAVKEDGSPNYQMVDKSALIPLLTAAIQEQQAIITQLQADVAALKGA
jgi:hypothetical protein